MPRCQSLLLLLSGLWLPALGDVLFRCTPCSPERLSACPPGRSPAQACAELVKEPGCGCCPVCARAEGESCGVYTPRCAQGLRCYPSPGSDLPLQALVQGQGTCAQKRDEYVVSQERATDVAEDHSEGVLIENQVDGSTVVNAGGGGVHGRKGSKAAAKDHAAKLSQHRQLSSKTIKHPHHVQEPMKSRLPLTRSPCQQQLDQVLERISTMPLADERGPLELLYAMHIPNCDKSGLYNLKQCKMSLNGQRGECWCVDPTTGKDIPGAPTVRGDPECHLYFTGHKQEDRGTVALRLQ